MPDVVVEAERRYLHRVIQNLVGNAVRYCDNKVLISGGLDQDGQAYVSVEDDGPGIPEVGNTALALSASSLGIRGPLLYSVEMSPMA